MEEIQRFALERIYCAPSQDSQYRFGLVRVTKKGYPARNTVSVYNNLKTLPNTTGKFHVYVAGNIPLSLVNLLQKEHNWTRDTWYNIQEDMNARNLLIQIYDQDGLTLPRVNLYYARTTNDGLVIAIEVDTVIERLFNIEGQCFIRFYSNEYFTTQQFRNTGAGVGIYCTSKVVLGNQDKVQLQNEIQRLETSGGKTLVYVNGYYSDGVSLHIPDNSLVEIVYDNSIISKEVYNISELRTFDSIKDNKLKYFLFRKRLLNSIQYEDDVEVYITKTVDYQTKGLYFYQHKDYAFTNVTDKDFAIYSAFVNTQAQRLSDLLGGGIPDKQITLLTRKSGSGRPLIYSSLKLHELYKLPDDKEYDVISNTNYTLSEFRVENLENSDYFKVASASAIREVTKELATSAIGYNGTAYYFGNTPVKLSTTNVDVPRLYQKHSLGYEYDVNGKLIAVTPSTGPMFTAWPDTRFVEFIQGTGEHYPSVLYHLNEAIPLEEGEYRVITAQYEGSNRLSVWEDITDSSLCVYTNNTVTVNDTGYKRIRIFYLDRAFTKDLSLPFVDGVLIFPITVWEDRGDGYQNYLLDIPYDMVEVFLNGNRLVYGIDFFMDFPYIGICNKTYIDYTLTEQLIHIRLSGYNLDQSLINSREIRGFVSHGVLTRNNYYDIREDRVFSTFINGKLIDNQTLRFSEEDSVVRVNDPLNGLPYAMVDHMVSIKAVTGLPTLPYFDTNLTTNTKISDLYNIIYPEPNIPPFNVIGEHHYLYSTVVSKIIHDLLDGNIPPSVYTNPYNDTTINDMLTSTYKRELALDPVKANLPDSLVEIHPHFGNAPVAVNIYQYRFLTNLVRILTQGKPDRINLSGYLTINTETVDINTNTSPGGIVVL